MNLPNLHQKLFGYLNLIYSQQDPIFNMTQDRNHHYIEAKNLSNPIFKKYKNHPNHTAIDPRSQGLKEESNQRRKISMICYQYVS